MAKAQVTRIHDGTKRILTKREQRQLAADEAAAVDVFEEDDRGNLKPARPGRDIFDADRN